MNHGSIGFIDKNAKLFLQPDVLKALCLGHKSKLYGIYYPLPPKKVDPYYENATIRHDLMLTPIPPRLWPVSARIHMHLLQKPGTLKKVCEYFKLKGISIIHAESTRSAHRYATWSLHIAFELLKSKDLKFIEGSNYFYETHKAVEDIKTDFKNIEELRNLMFEPDTWDSVEGGVNSPLAYFTSFIRNRKDAYWIEEDWLIEPFELTVKDNSKEVILAGDKRFETILKHLDKKQIMLPATTFSELDTGALNIRTAILTQHDRKRFFMVGIKYERTGQEDTCVGLIHDITRQMPDAYNIWRSFNYTINSLPYNDEGNLFFLIEDTTYINKYENRIDGQTMEGYIRLADEVVDEIIKSKAIPNVIYKKIGVVPLPDAQTVKKQFEMYLEEREKNEFKFDVFISYHNDDGKDFVDKKLLKILRRYKVKFHDFKTALKSGDKISEELLRNILRSREMCVIVSPNSTNSEWVTTEWGAAWLLDMRIVPITLGEVGNIPDRLKQRLFIKSDNKDKLIDYAKSLVENRHEADANKFAKYFW